MKIVIGIMQYIICIMEAFMWWRLTKNVMELKYNKKYHTFAAIGIFLLTALKQFLVSFSGINNIRIICTIGLISFTFIMIFVLFKNSYIEKIIWWGIFYLGLSLMEIATIIPMSYITGVPMEKLFYMVPGLWIVMISKILTIILFEIIIRKRKNKLAIGFRYSKELILIIGFNVLLVIGTVFTIANTNYVQLNIEYAVLVLFSIVLIMTLGTIILIFRIEKKSQEELENKLKFQQIEMELQINHDMVQVMDKLRMLRHDMNNHLGLIKALASAKDFDRLQEYIEQIYEDVETANDFVIIENKAVAALLNAKISNAKEKNIEFKSMISNNEIKMKDKDICALLGNLLDNAIEAAERNKENKYIDFTLQNTTSGCLIRCENSYAVGPVIKRGKFITAKEDKQSHGIGIEHIKAIVAKYKGEISFDYDEESFCIKVLIPV
ncbi:MAG: GHKL domain-containing protein [Mobilitalea sp.]